MAANKKVLKRVIIGVAILLAALFLFWRYGTEKKAPVKASDGVAAPGVQSSTEAAIVLPEPLTPVPTITPVKTPKAAPLPSKPKPAAKAPADADMAPPPVELHKELIPKDIAIVRFYYGQPITGPAAAMEFEINGSGFTAEFEKMITVKSGHPKISLKSLNLVTPNQIHGIFSIDKDVQTGFVFPQVLIQGKVVFQAPDPFAVIRPGEVLNLVFTEMEEGGRSGWFRVYTNLSEETFKKFSVQASTVGVEITDLRPELPFMVNGRLEIGWRVPEGTYDLFTKLGDKTTWERKSIIQVIKPNVGSTGLIQKIITTDGFHRPGDQAKFILQGSGFQPGDVNLLLAKVDNFENFPSTFSYVAPGRLDMTISIPLNAPVTTYSLGIFHADKRLFSAIPAFSVVEKNWVRGLELDPPLTPGTTGFVRLKGRDLEKDFVENIQIEVDEPALQIGKFQFGNSQSASAPITVGSIIAPGDYWIKLTSNGRRVSPQFGSIVRIQKP